MTGRSNEAMERSGARDGGLRSAGGPRAADTEVTIVRGQMFARRSLPARYAARHH
jgi:hypothetical protein